VVYLVGFGATNVMKQTPDSYEWYIYFSSSFLNVTGIFNG